MSLADVVRSGIASANKAVKDLQTEVSHSAWIDFDSYGKPVYATAVIRPAIVEYSQRLRRRSDGQLVQQRASIVFTYPITANGAVGRREPIDPRDEIVLPSGYTGPILDILGLVDPKTKAPYMLEVILG